MNWVPSLEDLSIQIYTWMTPEYFIFYWGTEIKVRKKKKVKVSMQTNCYLNLFGFRIMVTKLISSPQTIGLMSIRNYYR